MSCQSDTLTDALEVSRQYMIRCRELETRLRESERTIGQLQHELHEAHCQCDSLADKCRRGQSDLATSHQLSQSKDEEISSLRAKLFELQQRIDTRFDLRNSMIITTRQEDRWTQTAEHHTVAFAAPQSDQPLTPETEPLKDEQPIMLDRHVDGDDTASDGDRSDELTNGSSSRHASAQPQIERPRLPSLHLGTAVLAHPLLSATPRYPIMSARVPSSNVSSLIARVIQPPIQVTNESFASSGSHPLDRAAEDPTVLRPLKETLALENFDLITANSQAKESMRCALCDVVAHVQATVGTSMPSTALYFAAGWIPEAVNKWRVNHSTELTREELQVLVSLLDKRPPLGEFPVAKLENNVFIKKKNALFFQKEWRPAYALLHGVFLNMFSGKNPESQLIATTPIRGSTISKWEKMKNCIEIETCACSTCLNAAEDDCVEHTIIRFENAVTAANWADALRETQCVCPHRCSELFGDAHTLYELINALIQRNDAA